MNETLRRALFRSGLDENAVATELGVDPKTVRRWLDGRMPYPRLRWRLATLLEADEIDLWPEVLAARNAAARPPEVVAIYPHRWSVPRDTWHRLFSDATREIAILAYSGLFIADDAGLVGVLTARATAGVKVRIALGDPDCPQVAERGAHEGIDTSLAAKIRNALVLYEPLSADSQCRDQAASHGLVQLDLPSPTTKCSSISTCSASRPPIRRCCTCATTVRAI